MKRTPQARTALPTVMVQDGYQFYFYSNETDRAHVHVRYGDAEVVFWLEPDVDFKHLPASTPRSMKRKAFRLVLQNREELLIQYRQYFSRTASVVQSTRRWCTDAYRAQGYLYLFFGDRLRDRYWFDPSPYPELQTVSLADAKLVYFTPSGLRWPALDVDVPNSALDEYI